MFARWQVVIERWCVNTSEIGCLRDLTHLEEVGHVRGRLAAVELFDGALRAAGGPSVRRPARRSASPRLTKNVPLSPSNVMPFSVSWRMITSRCRPRTCR